MLEFFFPKNMDPATVETLKESFLESLEPPSNFNDWLQGTHFSSRYLSQLERTSTACSQAICASNVAIASASIPLKGREKLLQQQLEKKKLVKLGKSSPERVPHDSINRERSGTEIPEAEEEKSDQQKTTDGKENSVERESSPHSGEVIVHLQENSPPIAKEKNDVKDGKKGTTPSTQKDRSKTSFSRKIFSEDRVLEYGRKTDTISGEKVQRVGRTGADEEGRMLTSAEIRAHLRDSYYQMKSANAFGNTFPALLTPLNRPLFHMYDEWKLPQGVQESRRTGTAGSSYGSSGVYPGGSHERMVNQEDNGEWRDLTKGMLGTSEGRIDYPYQNEVLNQTCLRNLMIQPSGPPAFYPSATRPRRAPPKVPMRS